MNFLAHAFLSFNHPEILVGNMISDFVKGKKKFDYPKKILAGIHLHRAIDTFTDFHPATKEAKYYLKDAAGAYSGAFVDVVYDHFLANDASQFMETTLQLTAQNTYSVLSNFQQQLPSPFRQMLPYMLSQNWLYNYHSMEGIQKSFDGVVRRANWFIKHRSLKHAFIYQCAPAFVNVFLHVRVLHPLLLRWLKAYFFCLPYYLRWQQVVHRFP